MTRTAPLAQRLQQQCVDWGTYWRASDAHGVELTLEQALELLRTALGVEVDIKPAPSGCKRLDEEVTQQKELFA
jgi:hypothetical protein